jgi:hypothetical protein
MNLSDSRDATNTVGVLPAVHGQVCGKNSKGRSTSQNCTNDVMIGVIGDW